MWKNILVYLFSSYLFSLHVLASTTLSFDQKVYKFGQEIKNAKKKDELRKIMTNMYDDLKKKQGDIHESDDAITLRSALELTLPVQSYTSEECISSKLAHFSNFGIRSNELMDPKDLPNMVKVSYAALTKLCDLKE